MKRILSLLLILTLAFAALSGCMLFEKDEEANYAQVIAAIEPYSSYNTERIEITKQELVNVINQNSQTVQQALQQGSTLEQVFESYTTQLVNRNLILLEADKLKKEGKLKPLTVEQENEIWKSVYSQIEDSLYSIMSDVAKEFGEDEPVKPTAGEVPAPKYAVKTVEEEENKEETVAEKWKVTDDATLVPAEDDYLKLEAISRFVKRLVESLEKVNLNQEDKAAFAADKTYLEQFKGALPKEYVKVYSELQDRFFIKYYFYKNAEENAIVQSLEKYIKGTVSITDSNVQTAYDTLLKKQQASYADSAALMSALGSYKLDGTADPIIYKSNVKYFFVKQVLIPFTEAQTAALTAYKDSGKHSDAAVKAYRESLASQITGYEHREGNDYGKQLAIQTISKDIYSAMAPYAGDPYRAELKFEELIYKYNTDPGAFNNQLGYGIQYHNPATGFVKEFQDGADKLYDEYKAGRASIGSLSDWIVTDYGVHILMMSTDVTAGQLGIQDYLTNFNDKTVYSYLKKKIQTERENAAFGEYAGSLVKRMRTQYGDRIKTYPKRYADVIEDLSGN